MNSSTTASAGTTGAAEGGSPLASSHDQLLDVLRMTPRGVTATEAQPNGALGGDGQVAHFTGVGSGHDEYGLYGGHMLGQGVAAACATTADDKPIHSFHAYFLRGGDGTGQVDYDVEAVRDGRSFCTRRAVARQPSRWPVDGAAEATAGTTADSGAGKRIFELTASFHSPEQGKAVIEAEFPSGLADPESLPTFAECMADVGPIFGEQWSNTPKPVEYRMAHAPWAPTGPSPRGGIDYWFHTHRPLPDDRDLHAAVLAYMSDDCISDNVLVPFGVTWNAPDTLVVSLDHTMWFHRPFRADAWVYVEQWPLVATAARGTAKARFWQDGLLVATAVQEALARI